jgi:hypothetical protein
LTRTNGPEAKDKASRRQIFDNYVSRQRQRNLHRSSQYAGEPQDRIL